MKIPGIFIILLFFPFSVHAQVLFSEIAWMGTHASSYDEWIELRNPRKNSVDLTGWRIESADGSPSINLRGKIPGKNFFLLERTDDTTTSLPADQIYTGAMGNGGEPLFLKDSSGNIIDQTPATWIAGDNASKKTMERYDKHTWKTFSGKTSVAHDANGDPIQGTPKTKNSQENFVEPPKEASTFWIKITEVSPTKFGEEDEWFEFLVEADGFVDLSEVVFSRGKYQKKFLGFLPNLEWNENDFPDGNISGKSIRGQKIPEKKAIFLPQTATETPGLFRGYFWTKKSPFSLPDSGGEIRVLHQGKDLDTFSYPKTKKTTTSTEVWNKDPETDRVYPLLFQPPSLLHSRGQPNSLPPETKAFLRISEIGFHPEKSQEFFELEVTDTANLQYTELVYKGKSIWFMPDEYLVEKGDRILVYGGESIPKSQEKNIHVFSGDFDGISSYSSTLSVQTFGRTSYSVPIDVVCWKHKTLSQTETNRLKKFLGNQWNGSCLETSTIPKKSSLARKPSSPDTNTSQDFFIHFIGSPGIANANPSPFNLLPKARITVQSQTKNSLNLTGEFSYDPNGDDDIAGFEWRYALEKESEKSRFSRISQRKNPGIFSFSEHKNFSHNECEHSQYRVSLVVRDFSGMADEAETIFPLFWDGACTLKEPFEKIPEIFSPPKPQNTSENIYDPEAFFADFLAMWDGVSRPSESEPKEIENPPLFQRDQFFVRTKRSPEQVRKNIGLIFEY